MNIPEGWKLVPVEPTDEMLDAAARASMQHLIDCIRDPDQAKELGSEKSVRLTYGSRYRAMLAAAPTPPAQDDYPPRMKREDDCMTLQDWRIRAMNLEASWANCSQACARIQGQRDEALEMLRSLAMAIERRQSLVGSPAWKQAHETFLDAMERARAMLAKRGKT